MKHIYTLLWILLLGSFNIEVMGQAPVIAAYDPAQGSSDVVTSKVLNLTFAEPVAFNPTSTRYYIEVYEVGVGIPIIDFQIRYGEADPGVSFDGTQTILSIDIPFNLNNNSTYYVIIDSGSLVSVSDGTEFSGIVDVNQWRFTTVALLLNPQVTNYLPAQDATGVNVNQNLELTFDRAIKFNESGLRYFIEIYEEGSLAPIADFQIRNGVADEGVIINNNVLQINPPVALNVLTTYYVLIDADGILSQLDGAGFVGILDPYQWRFTTSAPLLIDSYTPIQNAVDVALNLNPQLLFNQNIQLVSPIPFSGAVYIREQGTNREIQQYPFSPGTSNPNLVISGSAFTIELSQNLDANTATYITIPSGIIESFSGELFNGINNAADNNWRFTTVGAPDWIVGYPQTRNISMANVDIVGRTDKAGTYYYVVTTSATTPSVAQIKSGLDHNGTEAKYHNSATSGTMVANTEFVNTLNIAGLDIQPTTYYVYYVAVSNIGLDSSIGTTTFTTVERNAPTATFNPLPGATGVSVSSSIVVTYNEPVRNLDGSVIDNTNAKNLVWIPTFSDYSVTIDATKQILTITPNTPLASSTTYNVVINPVEDWFGNEQTDVMSSSFTTSDFATWNGSVSSDWSNPANWTGPILAGFNALIPSSGITNWPNVTTNTGYYVHDIVIEAGAELNISSTGTLLVTGYFVMVSSNTGKGNASLINNGTLTISSSNKVQIQQNVTSNPTKWMMISSPVVGATQANINCVGVVSEYNMSINEWVPIGANTLMDVAKGYQSYSFENMVFSGVINNASSYSVDAIKTTHNGGFNLTGNPYPCSIEWNLLDIGSTGLLNAFWVYLNDSQQYGTYNGNAALGTNLPELGSSVIPSHHAFWIRVPDGETSGVLTIPSSARVHNTNTYLKSVRTDNKGVIRLVGVNGEVEDETVIAFNSEAKEVYDVHDSEKRFASKFANAFEIFSIIGEKNICINSFGELDGAVIVPLGVNAPKDGRYYISLKELINFDVEVEVKLEDVSTELPTFIEMQEGGMYEFSIAQGLTTNRFNLHIQPKNDEATNIVVKDSEMIQIYSNNNEIYISIPDLNAPTYELYSVSGQLLSNGQLKRGVINKVHSPDTGVLIVKIISQDGIFTKKVFVK